MTMWDWSEPLSPLNSSDSTETQTPDTESDGLLWYLWSREDSTRFIQAFVFLRVF